MKLCIFCDVASSYSVRREDIYDIVIARRPSQFCSFDVAVLSRSTRILNQTDALKEQFSTGGANVGVASENVENEALVMSSKWRWGWGYSPLQPIRGSGGMLITKNGSSLV